MESDITQRKHADKAWKENEARYKALTQSAKDAIVSSNSAGNIIGWNSSAEAMFGYLEDEIIGASVTALMPSSFHSDHLAGMARVQTGGEKHVIGKTVEVRGLRKDGSEFLLEMSLSEWQVNDDRFYTAIIRDITERKRAEIELLHAKEALERVNIELEKSLARETQLARTDPLTNINNRRYLFELADREFMVATRYKQPLSVIMFDIDHFKRVNDVFEHAVGDQVLQEIVQVVCAQIRTTDIIGRYGGDEFLIVLPMTDAQNTYQLAQRIREAVATTCVPTPKGNVSVTLSIGIAEILHNNQVESVENLIGCADNALYAAKQAGRNHTMIAFTE